MEEIQTIAINISNLQFCFESFRNEGFLLNPKEKRYSNMIVTNMPNSMDCKYLSLYYFFYKPLKLRFIGVYTFVTIQIDLS